MSRPQINYSLYIRKVLRQVHPDTGINADTSRFLDKLLMDLIGKFANEFPVMKKDIKIDDMLNNILSHELAKHAVSEATKALVKYNATIEYDKQIKNDQKVVMEAK